MFGSMSIHDRSFAKTRFWQGFPSENQLNPVGNPASAANASGSLQTTLSKLPPTTRTFHPPTSASGQSR